MGNTFKNITYARITYNHNLSIIKDKSISKNKCACHFDNIYFFCESLSMTRFIFSFRFTLMKKKLQKHVL